ncbi:MAG: sensor histidine kinase, partial [Brachybacterium tyrofermentans]
MEDTTAPPPVAPRSRLHAAALASVLLGGLLFLSWFWISLVLLFSGLSALPALGSGLLLIIPWLLIMQGAVRIERRR